MLVHGMLIICGTRHSRRLWILLALSYVAVAYIAAVDVVICHPPGHPRRRNRHFQPPGVVEDDITLPPAHNTNDRSGSEGCQDGRSRSGFHLQQSLAQNRARDGAVGNGDAAGYNQHGHKKNWQTPANSTKPPTNSKVSIVHTIITCLLLAHAWHIHFLHFT